MLVSWKINKSHGCFKSVLSLLKYNILTNVNCLEHWTFTLKEQQKGWDCFDYSSILNNANQVPIKHIDRSWCFCSHLETQKLYYVCFTSGTWNPAQKNYSTIKKEILAIVLSIHKFQLDILNKKNYFYELIVNLLKKFSSMMLKISLINKFLLDGSNPLCFLLWYWIDSRSI